MAETKKEIIVGFRSTPEEREMYQKAAKADRRDMSSWIRKTLEDAARRQQNEKEPAQ